MKRTLKLVTSLCLSVLLILSTLGMSAFAATPKAHKNLQYKKYCYLGDSIPFGYGLVSQAESSDPFSVGVRVKNSYPDLVGDVLEASAYVRDTIVPAMADLRSAADQAETLTAESYYPFPAYDQLLFGV